MKRFVLAAALIIGLAMSARADFSAGVAAYNRGDYATALAEFKALAEQGQAKAQFNLGYLYEKGLGTPVDHGQAVEWYRKAAAQGHANAQNNMGVMYETGRGVPQDRVEAYSWYERAAAQGNNLAVQNLENLWRTMTAAQREAAEQRASAVTPPEPAAEAPAERVEPPGDGYWVQLVAVKSADAAEREWQRLRRVYGDLLADLTGSVERADLGSKGVFYRLRVGPIADKEAAQRLCDALSQRNQACMVVRP